MRFGEESLRTKRSARTLYQIVQLLKEREEVLKKNYGVEHLQVFGSYVEGRQRVDSDVDLIVSFSETPTLYELVDLKEYLESLLEAKVDLLTESDISPYIKPYIKRVEVF